MRHAEGHVGQRGLSDLLLICIQRSGRRVANPLLDLLNLHACASQTLAKLRDCVDGGSVRDAGVHLRQMLAKIAFRQGLFGLRRGERRLLLFRSGE